MKKNIRFWEQETKSESGFVYTFGIAIAHFHVGANRDSPLRNKIGINNSFYKSKFESPSNNIGAIIRGYKSSVTKQINLIRKTPGTKIWQRGYYDHIIRNEESLFYIREYIKYNPMNWNTDRFYQNR